MEFISIFDDFIIAKFVRRINRFVLECTFDKNRLFAYMPNPGRLQELLLKGVDIYLMYSKNKTSKYRYIAVAVRKDDVIVSLHTILNNKVAEILIVNNSINELVGAKILKREVTVGNSRFDFLLEKEGKEILLEVKSCTLFGKKIAMFPDAITKRGARHLEELYYLNKNTNYETYVLFIINKYDIEYFLPDFHTDFEFANVFLKTFEGINILAYSIYWNEKLQFCLNAKPVKIPLDYLKKAVIDKGVYLLLLHLEKDKNIKIGKLGYIKFSKGYYIYVGSAMNNLTARTNRHLRIRKKKFWHIDYFREHCKVEKIFHIRNSDNLESELSHEIQAISDWSIEGFGSSDCRNDFSHLFGFVDNPVFKKDFQDILLNFRINLLENKLI